MSQDASKVRLTVRWRYDDENALFIFPAVQLVQPLMAHRSGSKREYLTFPRLQESFAEELKTERYSQRPVVMWVKYGSEPEVQLEPVKLQDAMEKVLEHILLPGADLDTPELVAQRLWQHKLSDFCPRGHLRLFQSCVIVKRKEQLKDLKEDKERYVVWPVEKVKREAKRRVEELVQQQHSTNLPARRECHVTAKALHSYKLSRHSTGKVLASFRNCLQLVQFNECPLPVLLEDTQVGPLSCNSVSKGLHMPFPKFDAGGCFSLYTGFCSNWTKIQHATSYTFCSIKFLLHSSVFWHFNAFYW